ncbi:hypothetical protein NC652_016778 [Populus alba x Populus x berolinensis]|nr:hypothetical protein NC652_016778 [Populus alba x Populus x berolinensis]
MLQGKPENDVKVKAPNLIERAKEEIEAIIHNGKSPVHHHKETHGRNDDIDDSTPIDQVKGPSVFQRVREEIEALVQTIHRKKEPSNSVSSPKKEGGFGACIGKWLEKICSFNWGIRYSREILQNEDLVNFSAPLIRLLSYDKTYVVTGGGHELSSRIVELFYT